jgi:hypothetical protein
VIIYFVIRGTVAGGVNRKTLTTLPTVWFFVCETIVGEYMKKIVLLLAVLCLFSTFAIASENGTDHVVPLENGFILVSPSNDGMTVISTFLVNGDGQVDLIDEYHYKPAATQIMASGSTKSFTQRVRPN